jgi:hypothetical protein
MDRNRYHGLSGALFGGRLRRSESQARPDRRLAAFGAVRINN